MDPISFLQSRSAVRDVDDLLKDIGLQQKAHGRVLSMSSMMGPSSGATWHTDQVGIWVAIALAELPDGQRTVPEEQASYLPTVYFREETGGYAVDDRGFHTGTIIGEGPVSREQLPAAILRILVQLYRLRR